MNHKKKNIYNKHNTTTTQKQNKTFKNHECVIQQKQKLDMRHKKYEMEVSELYLGEEQ